MNNEFVTYKQAIALKELGFDEPCIAWYVSEDYGLELGEVVQSDLLRDGLLAPLKQQVFKWFRENYKIHVRFTPHDYLDDNNQKYIEDYEWEIVYPEYYDGPYHDTFEESENDCINTIIQLIKEKN